MTHRWIVVLSIVTSCCGALRGQSLWTSAGSTEHGLLGDHVARGIGDVLTVVVRENQRVQDDGRLRLARDTVLDSKVEALEFKSDMIDTLPAVKYSGSRTLDGDYKRMHVRGIARPIDILSDNTISSDGRANADVFYDTEGPRSYNTEKNWFEILLDWIWPF